MEILRTSTDQLKAQAGRLQSQGGVLAAKVDQMVQVADTLTGSVWSGEAADAFRSIFDQLSMDANDMRNFTEDYAEQLTTIANKYEEAEDMNRQAASQLPTDVFQF